MGKFNNAQKISSNNFNKFLQDFVTLICGRCSETSKEQHSSGSFLILLQENITNMQIDDVHEITEHCLCDKIAVCFCAVQFFHITKLPLFWQSL